MRLRQKCWLCNGTGQASVTRTDVLLGPDLPAAAVQIIREVADDHGLLKGDLVGPRRHQRIVQARDEAAYRMRTELDMTLVAIGQALGGRDHSTVIASLRRTEDRVA